jgi:hypothetical protein
MPQLRHERLLHQEESMNENHTVIAIPTGEILCHDQAAAILGMTPEALYTAVNAGKFPRYQYNGRNYYRRLADHGADAELLESIRHTGNEPHTMPRGANQQ